MVAGVRRVEVDVLRVCATRDGGLMELVEAALREWRTEALRARSLLTAGFVAAELLEMRVDALRWRVLVVPLFVKERVGGGSIDADALLLRGGETFDDALRRATGLTGSLLGE